MEEKQNHILICSTSSLYSVVSGPTQTSVSFWVRGQKTHRHSSVSTSSQSISAANHPLTPTTQTWESLIIPSWLLSVIIWSGLSQSHFRWSHCHQQLSETERIKAVTRTDQSRAPPPLSLSGGSRSVRKYVQMWEALSEILKEFIGIWVKTTTDSFTWRWVDGK